MAYRAAIVAFVGASWATAADFIGVWEAGTYAASALIVTSLACAFWALGWSSAATRFGRDP